MRPIYEALGMTVGVIEAQMVRRRSATPAAYACDITYGTNSEFGFDYLRDNLAADARRRPSSAAHYFAIVDEVDSILIDEARTPLIIAGQPEEAADIYYTFASIVRDLSLGRGLRGRREAQDRGADRGGRDQGREGARHREPLRARARPDGQPPDPGAAAQSLYQRDVEYLVVDGEVKIVDEFTGRIMEGRRWSEGLHQAVEAKEGVKIEAENVTVATVTIQNYFRLYEKLAGMTGTALTEANEFHEIYGLEVVPIPTNVPVMRIDRTT